jgi:hypothetical protein
MSVVMPAKYVGAPLEQPAVSSGRDMPPPSLQQIRAIVGGRRGKKSRKARKANKSNKSNKSKKARKGSKKQSGGFLPSIGEPFVNAVGKYIAPLALYGVYKFINGSKTKKAKTRKARK